MNAGPEICCLLCVNTFLSCLSTGTLRLILNIFVIFSQGYFQALFSCIEKLLSSLNVENLVLPAAEEAESIWTKKFGFKKMSEERVSSLHNFVSSCVLI